MTKIFRVSPENPEGILVDLTAEEEAQRITDGEAATAKKQAEVDAKIAQDAVDAQTAIDQGTGNTKLLDLGLTQAEATALTGYTPPAV